MTILFILMRMAVHNAQMHKRVTNLSKEKKIAVIAAEFNDDIMGWLIQKNISRLEDEWFKDIVLFRVPWCFELPSQAKRLLESWMFDMIMILWCVIRGETPHFDYVCTECSRGIMNLSLEYQTPLIFWVLTCDTLDQALARVDDNYAVYWLNYLAQCEKLSIDFGEE